MEKKQWVKPDLAIYGDVATVTKGNAPCVLKVIGFSDDFIQNPDTVGSSVPAPCP